MLPRSEGDSGSVSPGRPLTFLGKSGEDRGETLGRRPRERYHCSTKKRDGLFLGFTVTQRGREGERETERQRKTERERERDDTVETRVVTYHAKGMEDLRRASGLSFKIKHTYRRQRNSRCRETFTMFTSLRARDKIYYLSRLYLIRYVPTILPDSFAHKTRYQTAHPCKVVQFTLGGFLGLPLNLEIRQSALS